MNYRWWKETAGAYSLGRGQESQCWEDSAENLVLGCYEPPLGGDVCRINTVSLILPPKETSPMCIPLATLLSHPPPPSFQAPAQSHPASSLHPPADLHHGRSLSLCTLPPQRSKIRSLSASLWYFRSQYRWGFFCTVVKGGRGESLECITLMTVCCFSALVSPRGATDLHP